MRKILPDGCAATRQNLPACRSVRPTSRTGDFRSPALALIPIGKAGSNLIGVFHKPELQLAAGIRSEVWRFRRHTALQYSTFSQSRAVRRLNSIGSPQTLHSLVALPRFKATILLRDSVTANCRIPKVRTSVSISITIRSFTPSIGDAKFHFHGRLQVPPRPRHKIGSAPAKIPRIEYH